MSGNLNRGPSTPNARPANDTSHRYTNRHHQGPGLPSTSTSTSILRDYQGQYPYNGHSSHDRLADGMSPPYALFEGSNGGLSRASINPSQGFHAQRHLNDRALSGRQDNGESSPFANNQEFNGGPSASIRQPRASHSRRSSNSTNYSSSSHQGSNGRSFSMSISHPHYSNDECFNNSAHHLTNTPSHTLARQEYLTLPPPSSLHVYHNGNPVYYPHEYAQNTQSHRLPYHQRQSPPEQRHHQPHPNHHLRHSNTENQGGFHSVPPSDRVALPGFGALEHVIQERESQDQRPHQNRNYGQISIQKQSDDAPMEGLSGSQGHCLNMADPDSSMIPDFNVGPSEHLPSNETFTSISYRGQSHEFDCSNNAEPFNNDVDMNSDAKTHSGPTRFIKRHKANDSADTKGKVNATSAPKNGMGKGRTDAGSPKVNMKIIYETGHTDPSQKKKKGRPPGSKNKPKTDAEPSKFKEPKASKPKKAEKVSKSKDKSVEVSKPTQNSNHRANKRAREPETEDEVDQLEDQDNMEAEPETAAPPSNSGGPSECWPSGGLDSSPFGSPSKAGGPSGSGCSGGRPSGSGNSNNNASGSGGPHPGPPSDPSNPGEPGSPAGHVSTLNDVPQDNGYRYGVEGTIGGTDATPPGSPISSSTHLVSAPLIVQQQLQEFMDFMCGYASSGAVFSPWRGIVSFDCRNLLQFQQFCNMFSATFSCFTNASVMNFLPYYKFELRIKFTFHWTQEHVEKLSRVLQEVKTLERLDLQLCTAAEFNISRCYSQTKPIKMTRTTCCTSHLMNLISDNPHIYEVRLRGVGTFFIRDFAQVPDMRRLKVLEMDVDAWEPPAEPEGQNKISEMYCRRYEKVLDKLSGLEMMVLHCPSAPGAFVSHLKKMRPMMYTLAHAKNVQPQRPRIQRGGFLINFKAPCTTSTFEIGRLDAEGNMTDVHAVFTNGDYGSLKNWFTDNRIPEMSSFRGLFDHATLWSHTERLTTTGRLPVWCMNALKARRSQNQMTRLHGMALQDMVVKKKWWDHFLGLLASLRLEIFVMRDCAFPGDIPGAVEAPTNWNRLFSAVGQQGQVTGLGLVNIDFGDSGTLLLRELWSLVDAREISEQNAEGQMVPVLRPRWNALTWVDITGSVNTKKLGWAVYGPFLDSKEARRFRDVRVIDPEHFID
ncbi:hypothetical protein BGZ92_006527 [Podila epicladia]|nr:hypothetical protein BGZ92_006527 [Podila epicladia]